MAREAVRILLMRLEKPDDPPVSAIVDAKLVIRRSARLTEA
jgi:DNA-binding LacI/PurR family transcriptional regulator